YGAEVATWYAKPDPGIGTPLLQQLAEAPVGGHPSAELQVHHALLGAGEHSLAGEHVDDRLLERRRDVGHGHRLPRPLPGLDPSHDGRLQPAEGEVVTVPLQVPAGRQPPREADRGRITLTSSAVDLRPTGVGQAEDPSHLVEGLTGSVVNRLPQGTD